MATHMPITILMAEDDPDDSLLAREALAESRVLNHLYVVEDGEELLDFLRRQGKYANPEEAPRPSLILLDLNMPRKDGREALAEIKADPALRQIPVVVLTTSQAEEDIYRTYDLGVSSFITKPVTFEGLIDVMRALGRYWLEIVELPPRGWSPVTATITVLLIDDDEDSAILTRDLLADTRGRYELIWAPTAADARATLDTMPVDICLVDWFLGADTGSDVLALLSEVGYTGAVIILTGLEDEAADAWSEEAGVGDYLLKSEITPYLLDRSIRYAIKRAVTEHALRESELRYRDLFENALDAVLLVDPSADRVLTANRAALTLFDAPEEWFRALPAGALFDESHPGSQAAAQSRTRFGWCDHEVVVCRRDGVVIPARVRSRVFRDGHGVQRASMVIHDLTVEVHAREANAALAAIVLSSADAIAGITLDGVVTSWNPAAEAMYGIGATDALGQRIDRLVSTAAAAREIRKAMSAVAGGLTVDPFEFATVDADGQRRDVSVSISPVVMPDGRITGLSVIHRDVTHYRRAEELRMLRERAEAASRAKSELLRMTSHEFRTPLAAILGFAQVLKLSELTAHDARSVDYIMQSGQHLQRLVDDFLELASIEGDRFRLDLERVDAMDVALEVGRLLEAVASPRGIRVVVSPGRSPLHVRADRHRLLQVLLNLVSNAIKYNHDGGHVHVAVLDDGAVAVADTGPGIAPEFLPHIFDPFAREETVAQDIPGTGLGLPIVKALLEAMGGTIEIRTEPGKGSTFIARLPRWEEPPVQHANGLTASWEEPSRAVAR